MHGYGGSRRAIVSEILAIDFVVSGEVIHVDEVGGDLDHILQSCPRAAQNVADIFDHGASLHANVELRRSHRHPLPRRRSCCRRGERWSRTQTEIARAFDVRKLSPRLRLAFDDFAFRFAHLFCVTTRRYKRMQILFSSE